MVVAAKMRHHLNPVEALADIFRRVASNFQEFELKTCPRRSDFEFRSLRFYGTLGKVSQLASRNFQSGGECLMLSKDGFVRVKEAAKILGVCPNTVRTWGADGKLKEYRHPLNNYRLFKRKELEHVLKMLHRSAVEVR